MGAIADYAALIDAVNAQKERVQGPPRPDIWGGETAKRFRADPKRQMEDNFQILADFVRPEDIFVDVGGGAGRLTLPISLRCREVINAEPSAGMVEEFDGCVAEAGIANARSVQADWVDVDVARDDVQGDVVHASNVTYFVRDIDRFAANLEAAARRRVIITLWSVANPMHNATLFKMVYGEDQATVPGHAQLLPALWEMGILPDVRFLPHGAHFDGVLQPPSFPQSKEDAVEMALAGVWLVPQHRDRAEKVVRDNFDRLFEQSPEGFVPLWLPDAQQVLITWETGKTS
jgi:hypothetical protein